MSSNLKDDAEKLGIDYVADRTAKILPRADQIYKSDENVCGICECTCTIGDCRDCSIPIIHALHDISLNLIRQRGI